MSAKDQTLPKIKEQESTMKKIKGFKIILSSLMFFVFMGFPWKLFSQVINFDSDQWKIVNGNIYDYLGRKAFKGTAFLKEVEFINGIIEVDIAVTGARSYPGIMFRMQKSMRDYENVYIRPHRAGLYPDALQYTPSINGISEWQLCNGEGYTSPIGLPKNRWVHLKVEVLKNRARIFIDNNPKAALEVNNLKHGISKGKIGLTGPLDGSAYFSNFQYQKTDSIVFGKPPIQDYPVGMVMNWEISPTFKALDIELEKTPDQQGIRDIKWTKVKADPSGLVDIGKYTGRTGRAPDVIFAKTVLYSKKAKLLELRFGYSDVITVFLNGKPLFLGNSSYQSRDRSFLGIIGLHDTLFVPLKEGRNELHITVIESFGGWAFMFQDANAVYTDKGVTKIWETDKIFKTSESVLYDPKRDVLYVTNFDQFNMGNPKATQYISKLSLKGEIIVKKWIDGLNHPLGMTIYKNKLYVAERKKVAVIDMTKGVILKRFPVKGSIFLNDIAVDRKGKIYISDSRKNVIWKSKGEDFEEWLTGPEISGPNVLYIQKNKLLIGNSGDQQLKAIDISNKSITTLAHFPKGFIDGIRSDGNGNLLVSLWKGKIYRVSMDGKIKLILHTVNKGLYSADFEYIPKKKMLIVPAFHANKVVAYKINEKSFIKN